MTNGCQIKMPVTHGCQEKCHYDPQMLDKNSTMTHGCRIKTVAMTHGCKKKNIITLGCQIKINAYFMIPKTNFSTDTFNKCIKSTFPTIFIFFCQNANLRREKKLFCYNALQHFDSNVLQAQYPIYQLQALLYCFVNPYKNILLYFIIFIAGAGVI